MLETTVPHAVESNSTQPTGRRSRVRTIAGALGLILLLGACFWVRGLLLRADVANRDFVAYWTTGRLLAQHQNPYDQAAAFRIEKNRGATAGHAMIMRNPPWALFLAAPLGWFDAPTAGLLWLIAIIAAGLTSLQLIRPPGLKAIPLILIFFAPVLICVETEQMSLFVLLGVAFFASLERRRPFWAGVALTLVLLKPHVLLIFLLVLALDILRNRRVALIGGFIAGFLAANVAALVLDHAVWQEYFASMGQERLQDYFYPNVANICRLVMGGRAIWPLAVPLLIAAAWAMRYWWKHSDQWDWPAQTALIAAVSIFVAPYSYPYDDVLFWPLVLACWPRASLSARAVLVALDLGAIAVTLRASNVGSLLYLWTGTAWMLWCLYAGWRAKFPSGKSNTLREARTTLA